MDASIEILTAGPTCVLTAVLAVCCFGISSAAQTPVAEIPWRGMTIGAPPPDFLFRHTGQGGPGEWIVVEDEGAAAGRAIAQVSGDRTDYRFPLAIYQQTEAKNLEVTVRFKAVSGEVDRAGGIALRLRGPDDYYVVRANALENNVRFYRVFRGVREQLAGVDIPVAADTWHSLGLRAEEEKFTIMFNGAKLFTATDRTITDPGKFAFWTKADSVTRFDRPTIRVLP